MCFELHGTRGTGFGVRKCGQENFTSGHGLVLCYILREIRDAGLVSFVLKAVRYSKAGMYSMYCTGTELNAVGTAIVILELMSQGDVVTRDANGGATRVLNLC